MKRSTNAIFGAAFVLTAAMLSGCASRSDIEPLATKAEVEALRAELMNEIAAVRETATKAEQSAAASAADADAAAKKAEAIFRKTMLK
jgi:outer membrane murein-binding lipoprotein Lpp